jgi:hypothetical protein
LDEEKLKCAGLAQGNGSFGSAKLQSLQWLVQGAAPSCTTCEKERNKYDLTAAQCF